MVEKLENEDVDRISGMPDLILVKILSFLPTKNAVGTIILSKRWKLLFPIWVPPIKLDLHDNLMLHPVIRDDGITHPSFVEFIDKLLNTTLVDAPYVDSAILRFFKNYDDEKIISWVKAILRLKVRDLDIWVKLNDPMPLFEHLHGCETLVRFVFSIKFQEGVTFVPPNFRLPNLKVLCVRGILFNDKAGFRSINRLIGGCPAIEELSIKDCSFEDVKFLRIESQLLKNITIENCWALFLGRIKINAPNVKMLIYKKCDAQKFRVRGFKSLDMAFIEASSTSCVAELLTACSSTVRLCLSSSTITGIQHLSMNRPIFQNLTWLELGCLGSDGWTLLPMILNSTPYLQRLILKEGFRANRTWYVTLESLGIPSCLKLHLNEIDVWGFKQGSYEIMLIEYFLRNGVVPQIIRLHYDRVCKDLSNFRRLLVFPGDKKLQWTEIRNGVQISVQRL